MRKLLTLLLSTLTLLTFVYSCYKETALMVKANFTVSMLEDNLTAPVSVSIKNNSTGSDFYEWTFEGGEPSSSNEQMPPPIIYANPGNYTIKLKAWNDTERDEEEFTFQVDSMVLIDFEYEILVNNYAPATVRITNKTQGASSFNWSFEGGEPTVSTKQHPEEIIFSTPGEYEIGLEVSNGNKSFNLSKTIEVLDPIVVDFDVILSFNDFDNEAPLTANLVNKSISAINYLWTSTGGVIDSPNKKNATIHFSKAGDYTITLQADNKKQTKIFKKQISVKPNSNLYTMTDVKFGVKLAASTVGSFYSLSTRNIIKQDDITPNNGLSINLAFFGINDTFNKCYFLSPDKVHEIGFYNIPNAQKTYFINTLESSPISFSSSIFDSMLNDSPLQALDIKGNSNTTDWFLADKFPRIVLFETEEGKKGAIKIKGFVVDSGGSYILTDIKFQKETMN